MMFFIFLLSRLAFHFRYRVEIKGLEKLKQLNPKGGILFLPNHPAHMDPWLLFSFLWFKYRMRPLVIEYIYRHSLLRGALKRLKAVSVPNFENSINQLKVKRAKESINTIVKGLKIGENFIVWPAGKLKKQGKEVIGGASGTHALVQECSDVNIVLIRTTGLWGSSFSRAILGRSPDILQTAWHAFRVILKNLIFFTPRRKVLIEIETNPEGFPKQGDRLEFNRFLEKWYNQYPDEEEKIHEVEPLKLVSYSFWRKDVPVPFQPKRKKEGNGGRISADIREKVLGEIRRILQREDLEIKPEMNLALDLGMDSLGIAELIVFVSHHYDVGEIHPEDMETVQSVLELAQGIRNGEVSDEDLPKFTWPEEKGRPLPVIPEGRILQEAFLIRCERLAEFSACGDNLSGVITYQKLKRAVLVLAEYFRRIKEERIAVLLPASVGAYITILAIYFAKKIPVMLNWTLGPRYLEEMMKASGAKQIITSWRFLDRVTNMDVGDLDQKMIFLEDIRASLSLKMKLKGAILAHCSPSAILRKLELNSIDEDSPAVILFTSGTEASPKGVPLSHTNIISNQRSAFQCLDFIPTDAFYGILPPFHSFGFSVTGLFPLLMGIKVAYYPDPTDSFGLAEGIERWKIAIFCSAPSFLKGLFHAAKEEQLKTLRLIVTGAEKAPPELYKKAEKIGKKMIEGYGITECSPILSVMRLRLPPIGVGQPLPDVEVCTVHPETGAPLARGAEGELCFRGPNVFHGYLGNPRSPFIEIDGKQWYRSGDIGHLDESGNIILSGRLKRFTKVGGEMISLGAVEETLIQELKREGKILDEAPSIAILADESNPDKSQLILFATIPIEKDRANELLSKSGFSSLIKISSVQHIQEIPLLGVGKTDYRKLQSLIQK